MLVAVLVALCSMVGAGSSAHAATLPGFYSIQAERPAAASPYLFVQSPAAMFTTQPLRINSGDNLDSVQVQRGHWQIVETTLVYRVFPRRAYFFVNRYSHGCMELRAQSGPEIVTQATYPGPRCSKWVLTTNNLRTIVRFGDPVGTRDGYQVAGPQYSYRDGERAGFRLECMEVARASYTPGNHIQTWPDCHSGIQQRFHIRRAG